MLRKETIAGLKVLVYGIRVLIDLRFSCLQLYEDCVDTTPSKPERMDTLHT